MSPRRAGTPPPPEPERLDGKVADELRNEFPGLGLISLVLPFKPGPSSPGVREHLRMLSGRFRGATAVTLRQQPVPHAYRVFFRHIGLDPDETRVPAERAAIDRLVQGEFVARNRLDDALTVALVETGVPIWALDADRVDGPLAIRLSEQDERLGRDELASYVPAGRIVVADNQGPLAPLFGEIGPGHGVSRHTKAVVLFAVRVDGVPAIHVEEALWTCGEVLTTV
jgi:DNA/RNA-binding domain of Phe-tRNA-synthetase-like protein